MKANRDALAAQWEEGVRFLELFRQREGHCRVPQKHREQGYRLGAWVHNQRKEKDTMLPERRARLDMLGFVWDPFTAQWEEGFRSLEIFRQREGHCRVPQKHREQGYRLGAWVHNQRVDKETMLPDRRQRLDALGFVWDPFAVQWEEGFRFLEIFHQREGHCRVPQGYREQGFGLGTWVSGRRQEKETLSPERRQRLDALGFVWDPFATQWDEGVRFLELFRQREGHCRVPASYREPVSGYRLGSWVITQRQDTATMLPERRARLDALGFVWDPLTAQWEEGFRSLEIFHQREGHCRVPFSYSEQGFRLGQWVSRQRQAQGTVLPERRARLDMLGFVWDPFTAQWEIGLHFLQIFRQREGHCRVPKSQREQGYPLGQWVNNQRQAQDTMPPDRRQRLDALGFVWDPFAVQWEEGFRSLERYRQDKGDCRVPGDYCDPTSGYRLGSWVNNQRQAQDTMPPDRRQRLDALGFVWDPFAVQWEEGFRFLEHYRQENGDCRVPRDYCDPTSGYRLGSWVNHQRRDQDTMLPERHQRLDALGFAWDPFGASWEEGFLSLERYHKENGDCLVPLTYRDPMSGFLLGQWVSVQRRPQMTMPPERRERLDALGFVWDPLAAQWEIGLHFLQIFCQREGHYRVPGTYRDPASGYRLGSWVNHQRRDRDTMPPERRARLDALGFVWKVR